MPKGIGYGKKMGGKTKAKSGKGFKKGTTKRMGRTGTKSK